MFERILCVCLALVQAAAIGAKKNAKQLPVRGRAPGALERYQEKRWRQLERVAQALRSLGDQPLSHPRADSFAKRFGVDRSTIYRYRNRLREVDETTAIAGRTRGWEPLASRLSAKQEEGIEEALNSFRKKAGPIRLIDLVEEVEVRCRLLRVQCPSRGLDSPQPAIRASKR